MAIATSSTRESFDKKMKFHTNILNKMQIDNNSDENSAVGKLNFNSRMWK